MPEIARGEILCLAMAPALDVTYRIDSLQGGRLHRPDLSRRQAGGKSFNVARALANLGTRAGVAAPLAGATGDQVESLATSEGIDLRRLTATGETRMCISVLDATTSEVTDFSEPAAPWAQASWDDLATVTAEMRPAWIVVSGAIAPVDAEMLAAALREANASGAHIALDTHGEPLRTILSHTPVEIVKVNRAEATQLVGPGDAEGLAVSLRSLGARTAIVTDGPHGSAASPPTGPPIRVLETPTAGPWTTGCGDSLMAAIVQGAVDDVPLARALASGTAAAAANTLSPGAAVFSVGDYRRLLPAVKVR